MAWTKVKAVVVTGAVLIVAAGTTTVLREKHARSQFAPAQAPWSDVGASSPKATLQSLAWALTHEKYDRASEMIQWDETGQAEASHRLFQQTMTLKSVLAPALSDIASFRILSIEPAKEPNVVNVKIEKSFRNNDIVPFAVTAKLRRVGERWRVVANLESDGSGGVLMRLPFINSFE